VTGDRGRLPAEAVEMADAPTERELVNRARAGDRDALGAIYDLYVSRIYRFVLAKVGSPTDAEDITAEVFYRVIEHIGSFEWRDVPFSAWIFKIAMTQIVSHHRKHGNRTASASIEDFNLEDSRPGPDMLVEHSVTMQEVFTACAKLPETQRQVIALRFAAGLSVRETADALGKTENNVKVLQHKAISKLQKLLRRP
jgi:RNA polymerase sigma-70 factor (ECF subfamily)